MVSVEEALQLVKKSPLVTKTSRIPILEALDCITAKDIYSPVDSPPFRQSAMDGYALRIHNSNQYSVVGEIKAGDSQQIHLQPGEAVRIFTGAMVPDTANSVVMQEKVDYSGKTIELKEKNIEGSNIRPCGEQLKKGELALKSGTKLTPPGLGFLAAMGMTVAEVHTKPKVGIVITGNELAEGGRPLKTGQIYECNSLMLQAALSQMGIYKTKIYTTKDDFQGCCDVLETAMEENDLLLISGGISVGDHDHVYDALKALEVETLFYKVKQKPGKPLLFGKKGDKLIFALPGNPASTLTCFYIYAYPALQMAMGHGPGGIERQHYPVTTTINNTLGRAQFLKAKVHKNGVDILEGQSSAMLQSYAVANALVYIPASQANVPKGSIVEILPLPNI